MRPAFLDERERILVACVRVIARRVAHETNRMPMDDAVQAASGEVMAEATRLGGVSESMIVETARYLGEEIRRNRYN